MAGHAARSGGRADQHTFGALFGRDLTAAEHRARHRTMAGEMTVAYLTGAGGPVP
jgi:hypothetical protein